MISYDQNLGPVQSSKKYITSTDIWSGPIIRYNKIQLMIGLRDQQLDSVP